MENTHPVPEVAGKVFGSSAAAFASHLFGTLTCATCWTIFGPSLALVFGSGGTAFLGAMRPYAPLSITLSAAGLAYSFYQLSKTRERSKLPYKLAAFFTVISTIGWTGSTIYTVITLLNG
jgi:hypothetical protein